MTNSLAHRVQTFAAAGLGMAARAIGLDSFWGQWGDPSLAARVRDGRVGSGRSDGLDSTWTAVAVTAIAEDLGQAPWKLLDADDNSIESGPLFDLLSRPNDAQHWRDFCEEIAVIERTKGAAAVILEYAAPGTPAGLPLSMFAASPAQLLPIWSPGALRPKLVGWMFTPRIESGLGALGGGAPVRLGRSEVIPIRRPDGTTSNPAQGLSPLTASRSAIQLDQEAQRFAQEYFAKDTSVGQQFETDQPLTKEQRRTITREIAQHGATAGRFAPLVLPKGVKRAQSTPMKDTAFTELGKQNRERQLAMFGVPPIRAGIVDDANRSNSDAQMLLHLTGPVMSLGDRIMQALNLGLVANHAWPAASSSGRRVRFSRLRYNRLAPLRAEVRSVLQARRTLGAAVERFGDPARELFSAHGTATGAPSQDLYLCFDFDAHPVIIQAKLGQATNIKTLTDAGMPLNHALDLLDFAVPREPGGDVSFLPFSMVPRDDLLNPPKLDPPPALGPAPAPAPGPAPAAGPDANKPAPDDELDDEDDAKAKASVDHLVRAVGPVRAAALRGIAERHRGSWRPLAALAESKLRAHLIRQRNEVLERIRDELSEGELPRSAPGAAGVATRVDSGTLARLVFDLEDEQDRIEAIARPLSDATARLGLRQGMTEAGMTAAREELAKAIDVLIDDPNVKTALRGMTAQYRLIEASRHEALTETIRGAFDQGKTFDELLHEVKDFYDGDFAKAKRTTITQVNEVLNTARHEGMRAGGATGKLWVTTSGNPRPTHAQAQEDYGAAPIPIDRSFIVGGAELRFPGDPNAPAAERINCYCVELAAFLDEHEKLAGGHAKRRLDPVIERYAGLDFITADDSEEIHACR